MKKPYIICHMGATIDGKIISANWGNDQVVDAFRDAYDKCHESYESQGWILGRVSLEKDFSKGTKPELIEPQQPIARVPFIGDKAAKTFAVTFDTRGTLGWKTNEIGGDHIVAVLNENVSDAYLYYLQRKNISYFFASASTSAGTPTTAGAATPDRAGTPAGTATPDRAAAPDIPLAMAQLVELFGIEKIMLEGGGHLNGAFLNAGLIDEISLLLLPLADGTPGAPTVFEVVNVAAKAPATGLKLTDVTRLDHDILWLKYRV